MMDEIRIWSTVRTQAQIQEVCTSADLSSMSHVCWGGGGRGHGLLCPEGGKRALGRVVTGGMGLEPLVVISELVFRLQAAKREYGCKIMSCGGGMRSGMEMVLAQLSQQPHDLSHTFCRHISRHVTLG